MLELYVAKPGLGLPSYQADSLASIAYCTEYLGSEAFKVISIRHNALPYRTPIMHDPDSNSWVSGFFEICQFLKKQGFGTEHSVDEVVRADAYAFTMSLIARLDEITELILLCDEQVLSDYTQQELAAGSQLPVILKRPSLDQCYARLDIRPSKAAVGPAQSSALAQQAKDIVVSSKAEAVYKDLEGRLQQHKGQGFFTEGRLVVDYLIYGHLACHVRCRVMENVLGATLNTAGPTLAQELSDVEALWTYKTSSTPVAPSEVLTAIWREITGTPAVTAGPNEEANASSDQKLNRSKIIFALGLVSSLIGFTVFNGIVVLAYE